MKTQYIFAIFTIFIFSITVLVLKTVIPRLISIGAGQKILSIGPKWHSSKEGTPTMGGIAFIVAGLIAALLFLLLFGSYIESTDIIIFINVIIFGILNALIGVIDDIAKIRKKQNEGLTPKAKFLLQSIFSIIFLLLVNFSVGLNTEFYIPFFNIELDLGFFYYLLAYIVLIGVVNSVNLTDGIDGLASSVVFTVGLMFSFAGIVLIEKYTVTFMGALLVGSSLGFLVYNFYPARIFMGDTGSLYLGGIVASASLMLGNLFLSLIYGFVFVMEAFSDILQVFYYKLTKGKRIFKMAPLHHHFEKSGWSEIKIVLIFSLLNMIFCTIAYFGIRL